MRNSGTGYLGVANLVSKDARDFKEKSHETPRPQLLTSKIYRKKCRGGGANLAPPEISAVDRAIAAKIGMHVPCDVISKIV